MKTLLDAHIIIESKLSLDFLSVATTADGRVLRGQTLVSLVNEINSELLNITMAINIFGGDFIVPVSPLELNEEYRSLFAGMYTWRQYTSHFYTLPLV